MSLGKTGIDSEVGHKAMWRGGGEGGLPGIPMPPLVLVPLWFML